MRVDGQSQTPTALPPGKRPDTHRTGGGVGFGASLDGCVKSRPRQNVASRHTDWGIPFSTVPLIQAHNIFSNLRKVRKHVSVTFVPLQSRPYSKWIKAAFPLFLLCRTSEETWRQKCCNTNKGEHLCWVISWEEQTLCALGTWAEVPFLCPGCGPQCYRHFIQRSNLIYIFLQ